MFNIRFDDTFNLAPYNKSLRCYSVIMMDGNERHNVNKGGKIILPPSALDHLTRLHIQYPMLFKLTNKTKNRITHCGVLEFIADEGRCHLPFWMMKNLLANEGDLIQVEYVNLRTAKFAKFQPQSVEFLEISNPKAVLENSLRDFATLTKGDTISINYNDKDYEVCVLDTRPDDAVSIIECDLDVDFAPPVGYEESLIKNKKSKATSTGGGAENSKKDTNTKPIGYRLDGKVAKSHDNSATSTQASTSAKANQSTGDGNDKPKKGIPLYDYKIGCLRFHHDFDQITEMETEVQTPKVTEVKGQKLKDIGIKQK